MSLLVVGINHRTAPVDVRERVVFEPAGLPDALRQLLGLPQVSEASVQAAFFATGADSPVSVDSSAWSREASSKRRSAVTTSPPSTTTMSPGTSSTASSRRTRPSRRTRVRT